MAMGVCERPNRTVGQRAERRIALVLLLSSLVALLSACTEAAPAPQPTTTPLTVVMAGTPAPTSAPSPTRLPVVPTTRPLQAAVAPPESPTTAAAALDETVRQQIFTEVWTTINENYLYADFRGADWSALRAEFAPLLAEAGSDSEFFSLIGQMVAQLDDNHSRFLPPQAAEKEDTLSSGREEQVGIGILALPLADALLIQHVFPGGPAARAGLLPRDRIVAIDGEFYARRDLQGEAGSEVRLTVVHPGASEGRDVVLVRRPIEGRISPAARRLPGDIGYVNVTTFWVNDMAQQVSAALADISAPRPLRGLIIDLRSNPGGWRSVLSGILSHFVRGEVGTFFSRKGDAPLLIEPGAAPDLRGVPLVVLVDRQTASYAELMAAILQQEVGAIVIGEPTAGNTETIYAYELTAGARLWVAQEGFGLTDGSNLEGRGVQPDVLLSLDWTRYSEENDPGIREGRRLLSEQAGGE